MGSGAGGPRQGLRGKVPPTDRARPAGGVTLPMDILLGLDFERSNPDGGLEKGGGDDDVKDLETPQIQTSTKPK